ncbi:MAG: DUF2007 domain-containing protein [Acidobacteria bacterium]|nr:DUF2007 domain-containing protein [Acidobacteriota bacterium]
MAEPNEPFVTVFRSADPDSDNEAAGVLDQLQQEGLEAVLAEDDQPGVVLGTREVRVPASQAARAEEILATPIEPIAGDASHDLDMVSVFRSGAEMEALAVRSVLDASGIPSLLMGTPQIPSLPFAVHVPRSLEAEANRIISEARAAGPEAAEAAEAE